MSNKISDSRAIRILIGNVCVKAGKNVFQIFLNIFIWKQTQDIQVVALFNLIYLITHMIFFTAFAPVVKKGYRNFLHIFSLVGFAGVYLGIMYLGEDAINHLFIIPVMIGFFNSIYWITYHNVQFDLTTYANRGNFEGIRKSLRMAASIITPALVGFLIGVDYFGYGYQIAFAFGASLFFIGAFIGAVAPKPQAKTAFDIVLAFKKCFSVSSVRKSLGTYSLTSFSFSNSVIEVLIPIILFSYTASEFEVGSYISIFAVVSIIASYLFGKFVDYKYYKISIFVLGMLYAGALLGFVAFQKIQYLVIFSTAITVFAQLFSHPQKVISDNVLHQVPEYKNMRSEYMVIREWFQAIGWIGTFLLIYFIGSIETWAIQSIFALMIGAVVICSFVLSRVDISKP